MVRSASGFEKRWAYARLAAGLAVFVHPGVALGQTNVAVGPGSQRPIRAALDVTWTGSCVRVEDLAARVARWLERPLVDARLRVVVQGQDEPELKARFELWRNEQRLSQRAFDAVPGEDCEDLNAALSFAVALSIDAAPEARTSPRPSRPALPTLPVQSSWQLTLESFASHTGPLGVAAGGSVGLGRSWPGLHIGAMLLGTLPRAAPLAEGSVEIWRAGVALELCGVPSDGRLALRVCARVAGGVLSGRGEGYAENITRRVPWLTTGGRVVALLRLTPRAGLGPGLAFDAWPVRPRFTLLAPTGAPINLQSGSFFGVSAGLNFEAML